MTLADHLLAVQAARRAHADMDDAANRASAAIIECGRLVREIVDEKAREIEQLCRAFALTRTP